MPDKILVIEDNPITRKLLQVALAADGFEVSAVARASEVDGALQAGPPDLVLLDLVLPDATGFEVLARLRATPGTERVPVLAVSGLSDNDRILEAGFTDHLLKPIETSRLVDRIRLHLRAARGSRPGLQRVPAIREHVALRSSARTVTRPELPSNLHREVIGDLERQAGRDADAVRGARRWSAMLGMLERVCELSETSHDAVAFHDQLLAVLLDASGFSLGLVYTCDGGAFALRSDLGLSRNAAPGPGDFFGHPGVLQHAIDGRQPVALDRTSASQTIQRLLAGARVGSMLLVPLARRGAPLGVIVLASLNTTLPPGWLELTRAMAGPIVQAITVMGMTAPIHAAPRLADVAGAMEPAALVRLANHDAVTGLLNRDRFMEALESRLAEARRYGTTGALALIDLEQLGHVNEPSGRAIREAVLRRVGDILASSTRDTDIRARLRDDQFGVILLHTTSATAEICANKLLARLEATTVTCEGVTLPIGASIGVAVFSAQGTSQHEILTSADDALYRAKLGSGRRVCVHDTNDVVTRLELADITAPS